MSDDYNCSRCGKGYKWEQMAQTPEGNLFCPECQAKLDAKSEPKHRCPVDGAEMQKRLVGGLVLIDSCSACGGTWFDKYELELIQKRWKDAGWQAGFFTGWLF
jgi:hypothetical protein